MIAVGFLKDAVLQTIGFFCNCMLSLKGLANFLFMVYLGPQAIIIMGPSYFFNFWFKMMINDLLKLLPSTLQQTLMEAPTVLSLLSHHSNKVKNAIDTVFFNQSFNKVMGMTCLSLSFGSDWQKYVAITLSLIIDRTGLSWSNIFVLILVAISLRNVRLLPFSQSVGWALLVTSQTGISYWHMGVALGLIVPIKLFQLGYFMKPTSRSDRG